jgi:hypothetical protein
MKEENTQVARLVALLQAGARRFAAQRPAGTLLLSLQCLGQGWLGSAVRFRADGA